MMIMIITISTIVILFRFDSCDSLQIIFGLFWLAVCLRCIKTILQQNRQLLFFSAANLIVYIGEIDEKKM